MGPGSAAHHHSVSKTRVNALVVLRRVRGTGLSLIPRRRLAALWRGRRATWRWQSRTLYGRRALSSGRTLQSGRAEPVRQSRPGQRRRGLCRRLLRLADARRQAWRQIGS
jgi:hypothetical protein